MEIRNKIKRRKHAKGEWIEGVRRKEGGVKGAGMGQERGRKG